MIRCDDRDDRSPLQCAGAKITWRIMLISISSISSISNDPVWAMVPHREDWPLSEDGHDRRMGSHITCVICRTVIFITFAIMIYIQVGSHITFVVYYWQKAILNKMRLWLCW